MKKKDNQKMNMYAAVLQTCRAQQTAWENIPNFVSAVAELESQLHSLHQTHVQQDSATLGVSANKNVLRKELIDHLFVIAKAMCLKGVMTNDKPLQERNKASRSNWGTLSANALLHRMDSVQMDLAIHGSYLFEFGITGAFIAETQLLMTAAESQLFEPRMAIIARKGLTQHVTEQRQAIDRLINEQLDTLILIFKNSLPTFFNSYRNARMIIDTGHHPKLPVEPDDGGLV